MTISLIDICNLICNNSINKQKDIIDQNIWNNINNIKGMPNFGNTCYFNAAFHCLFFNPDIRYEILNTTEPKLQSVRKLFESYKNSIINKPDTCNINRNIVQDIQKRCNLKLGRQDDADEIIRCIVNDDILKSSDKFVIKEQHDSYELHNGNKSNNISNIVNVTSLDITNNTINNALAVTEDIRGIGTIKIYKNKQEANKKAHEIIKSNFPNLPNFLINQYTDNLVQKNKNNYEVYNTINIQKKQIISTNKYIHIKYIRLDPNTKFNIQQTININNYTYKLYAITLKHGGSIDGHWTVLLRPFYKNTFGKWYHLDDNSVKIVNNIQKYDINATNLFYKRIDEQHGGSKQITFHGENSDILSELGKKHICLFDETLKSEFKEIPFNKSKLGEKYKLTLQELEKGLKLNKRDRITYISNLFKNKIEPLSYQLFDTMFSNYLIRYASCFYNSDIEGSIYFGVTDDGIPTGIPISKEYSEEDINEYVINMMNGYLHDNLIMNDDEKMREYIENIDINFIKINDNMDKLIKLYYKFYNITSITNKTSQLLSEYLVKNERKNTNTRKNINNILNSYLTTVADTSKKLTPDKIEIFIYQIIFLFTLDIKPYNKRKLYKDSNNYTITNDKIIIHMDEIKRKIDNFVDDPDLRNEYYEKLDYINKLDFIELLKRSNDIEYLIRIFHEYIRNGVDDRLSQVKQVTFEDYYNANDFSITKIEELYEFMKHSHNYYIIHITYPKRIHEETMYYKENDNVYKSTRKIKKGDPYCQTENKY